MAPVLSFGATSLDQKGRKRSFGQVAQIFASSAQLLENETDFQLVTYEQSEVKPQKRGLGMNNDYL